MLKSANIYILIVLLTLIKSLATYADEISSTNFVIKGDTVSSGGGDGTAPTFHVVSDINPFSDLADSPSFRQELGYSPRFQANTPNAPELENSENYYDRLLVTLNTASNPTDTLYAVIISDDNFATYQYVQNDGTVGAVLGTEDYRDYDSWGNSSGSFILGLKQNTTYMVRSKALHGNFTETGYSPNSVEATTTVPFVRMTISDLGLTLGTLTASSINQTTSLTVTVYTNSYTGYQTYVSDEGNGAVGGLYNGSDTIQSADMTLSAGVEGYGAQANSATATVDTKYDVLGNQVGGLELSLNPLSSNTVAVNGEVSTILFKAAIAGATTSGNYVDYVYFTVSPTL